MQISSWNATDSTPIVKRPPPGAQAREQRVVLLAGAMKMAVHSDGVQRDAGTDCSTERGHNRAMEVVELREEVGRLRRALCEESELRKSQVAALWLAIENLQREAKRRATVEPADPQPTVDESGDPQRTSAEVVTTRKRSASDAITQTDDEFKTAESANICHLECDQLKHILGLLGCTQLVIARRVCKRWKTVIDGSWKMPVKHW